ncbi:MAG: radical SAM protein, partial [Nanoarchaeota archaeon]|nr:radical SAM protein [Nanoarchaeota archaeon]
SVKIINTRNQIDYMEQILEHIKEAKIVGFTVMTAQIAHALMMSKKVKEFGKPVVWGGIHPELFKEQTIKNYAIDYIVYREGEETIYQLIKCLEKKGDLSEVLGIGYKKDGKIIINPPRPLLDINELVSDPDYSLLNLNKGKIKRLQLETSRGCPFRCTFCMNTIEWKHNWRALSVEKILDLVENLKEKYDFEILNLREEDFFVNKERVKAFVDGLIKRGIKIKWGSNCRASYFDGKYLNDEFVAKMKKSGLYALYIGVESGSKRIREFMKKDITEEHVYESIKLCGKHKIGCYINMMVGYPTETKKDIFDTMNMMENAVKINKDVIVNGPVPFRPYAGASIYDYCVKRGFKEPQSLEEWVDSLDFSGFVSTKTFPWIEKGTYHYVQNIGKYSTLAVKPFKNIWNVSPFLALFSLVCKLRWKLKFFRFPVDYALYKLFTKRIRLY